MKIVKNFTAVTHKGNEFYSKVRYFGLAAAVAMFAFGVFLAASQGPGGATLLNRSITGGIISAAIAWLAWVLTVRPRVTLSSESVKVRNWITETVVPYCCIARVRTNDGLVFELKDGYELRGRVVGNSLIGQFAGYPSAKRIRRVIQPFLSHEEPLEGEVIQERFSLSLRVPLVISILHALFYVVLKCILHVP